MSGRYQLFDPLDPEAYEALKADIAARGVMVPIEYDEEGNVLAGHNRLAICRELGIPDPPSIVRIGLTEEGKLEHAIKDNLLRRQLGPVAWAAGFRKLADLRGARLGSGARNDLTSATVAEVAAEVGVKERTARHRLRAARVLEAHPDLAAKVDAGEQSLSWAVNYARLRQRRIDHAGIPPARLPNGRFALLYADPPWRFDGFVPDRDVEMQYPTLTPLELEDYRDSRGRSIRDVVADDSFLALWSTNTHLPDALRVMKAWGFEYVGMVIWEKDKIGLGWYVRNQTEPLLLGRRGNVGTPLPEDRPTNVIHAPRGVHSAKPPEVYELLESMYPALGPRLELFARSARPGWESFGNQAPVEAASA